MTEQFRVSSSPSVQAMPWRQTVGKSLFQQKIIHCHIYAPIGLNVLLKSTGIYGTQHKPSDSCAHQWISYLVSSLALVWCQAITNATLDDRYLKMLSTSTVIRSGDNILNISAIKNHEQYDRNIYMHTIPWYIITKMWLFQNSMPVEWYIRLDISRHKMDRVWSSVVVIRRQGYTVKSRRLHAY